MEPLEYRVVTGCGFAGGGVNDDAVILWQNYCKGGYPYRVFIQLVSNEESIRGHLDKGLLQALWKISELIQKRAGVITVASLQGTNHTVVNSDMLSRYCCYRNKTDTQQGSTFFWWSTGMKTPPPLPNAFIPEKKKHSTWTSTLIPVLILPLCNATAG